MDVTEHAKPPRAMFLPFMMGHHFGVPFHKQLQTRIIKELLQMVTDDCEPGEIRHFDFTWAQARREGKEIEKQMK